jgi:hypothetical protein
LGKEFCLLPSAYALKYFLFVLFILRLLVPLWRKTKTQKIMTATAQQVKSTPMAPYIGLMRGMSRHDIQIVVTFLNEVMEEAEETKATASSDSLVEMARKKFNVPESPETKWFREHPVNFTEEELSDERTKYILSKCSPKR